MKRRKLKYFGHICHHDTLAITILQGLVEGNRQRGLSITNWVYNVNKWKKEKSLKELLKRWKGWKIFLANGIRNSLLNCRL